MVLPGRFELPFAASETAALSIELRELTLKSKIRGCVERVNAKNAWRLALNLRPAPR